MTCVACSLMSDFRSSGPRLVTSFNALSDRPFALGTGRTTPGTLKFIKFLGKIQVPGDFSRARALAGWRTPRLSVLENFGTIRL